MGLEKNNSIEHMGIKSARPFAPLRQRTGPYPDVDHYRHSLDDVAGPVSCGIVIKRVRAQRMEARILEGCVALFRWKVKRLNVSQSIVSNV